MVALSDSFLSLAGWLNDNYYIPKRIVDTDFLGNRTDYLLHFFFAFHIRIMWKCWDEDESGIGSAYKLLNSEATVVSCHMFFLQCV